MRIISKALVRYQVIMGIEKELFFFSLMVSLLVPYASRTWWSVIVGAVIWIVLAYVLRKVGKADPIYFKVNKRALQYQKFYPAKTPKWRVGSGYRAK